jgi:hypothetical protein
MACTKPGTVAAPPFAALAALQMFAFSAVDRINPSTMIERARKDVCTGQFQS